MSLRRNLGLLLGAATVALLTFVAWQADRLSPLFAGVAIVSLVASYRMTNVKNLTSGLTDIAVMVASTSLLIFLLVGLSWPLVIAVVACAGVLSTLPRRIRRANRAFWEGEVVMLDPDAAPAWDSEHQRVLEQNGFEAIAAYTHSSSAVSDHIALLMVNPTECIYAEVLDEESETGYGLSTQFNGGWLSTGKVKAIPPKDEDIAQVFPNASLTMLLQRHREAMTYLAARDLHPRAISRDAYAERVTDMIEHVQRVVDDAPTRYSLAVERMKRTEQWLDEGPIMDRDDLAARVERMRG